MEEVIIKLGIFSPRWGHEDFYEFIFHRQSLEIKQGERKAKCIWVENRDPVWEVDKLFEILMNDSIYPPFNFKRLIENAWESWRNGEIDNEELKTELQYLINWLNLITKEKPKSDYWSKIF